MTSIFFIVLQLRWPALLHLQSCCRVLMSWCVWRLVLAHLPSTSPGCWAWLSCQAIMSPVLQKALMESLASEVNCIYYLQIGCLERCTHAGLLILLVPFCLTFLSQVMTNMWQTWMNYNWTDVKELMFIIDKDFSWNRNMYFLCLRSLQKYLKRLFLWMKTRRNRLHTSLSRKRGKWPVPSSFFSSYLSSMVARWLWSKWRRHERECLFCVLFS